MLYECKLLALLERGEVLPKRIFLLIILAFCFSISVYPAEIVSLKSQNANLNEALLNVTFEFEIKEDFHVNSNNPIQEFLIKTELSLQNCEKIKPSEIVYPKGHLMKLDFSDENLSLYEKSFIIKLKAEFQGIIEKCVFSLNYQACDASNCYPPANLEIDLDAKILGSLQAVNFKKDKTSQDGSSAKAVSSLNNEASSDISKFEDIYNKNIVLLFLLIFLAGLGLNLTPCVYPLIPITVSFLGSQANKNKRLKILISFSYFTGIVITYSLLGLLASATGAVFGSLLQNTYVLVILALLVAFFSLSMFGLYEIRLPTGFLSRFDNSGLLGALIMGATASFIAAPCVGPVIATLLIFIAKLNNLMLGFSLFFVLAIGLALPYLVLGLLSSHLNELPKSGVWMVSIKKFFGFCLLGVAFYIVKPAIGDVLFNLILFVLIAITLGYFILIDKAIYMILNSKISKLLLVIILCVSAYFLFVNQSIEFDDTWSVSEEGIIEESISNNKKIMIDFYASWCMACKELNKVTFSNEDVKKEFADFVKIKVDMTKGGSAYDQELQYKYNVKGYPTLVFIDSKGKERKDLKVVGFKTPEEFIEIIQQIQ
ncbi:MAG: cytochrome c biogenesis protein CcdA [Pseudomonadota bacterium]